MDEVIAAFDTRGGGTDDLWIIKWVFVQRRIAHDQLRYIVRRSVKQHRVPVRRSTMNVEACDRAISAGAVLDDELNVRQGADLSRNQPQRPPWPASMQ
jgi:hypothetical protein